ncbi:hypothetical protein [Bryocella elongata]|nr:hypothetical protein [Bryocella elongata]
MMPHKITMVALIGGVVFGAAVTEGIDLYRRSQESYRQSRDGQTFQERAHCKSVADVYVRQNTDLGDDGATGTSVTLEKVDYSPGRNSCVAEVEAVTFLGKEAVAVDSVKDVLSGETLFSVRGKDADAFRIVFLPRVWDYVMNNADEPLELEKEYSRVNSEPAPQAAAPAFPEARPKDLQTLPAPEYDAQGKPITSPQRK